MSEDEKRKRPFFGRGEIREFFLLVVIVFGVPVEATDLVESLTWALPGMGMVLLGLTLHFISKGYLHRTEMLIRSGPYRFVRHPFYLANFIIDLGICTVSGEPLIALAYVVVFFPVYLPVMRREEGTLEGLHGDDFREYRKIVPTFFPYRIPPKAVEGQTFSWTNMLRESEVPRFIKILTLPALVYWALLMKADLLEGRNIFENLLVLKISLAGGVLVLQAVALLVHRRVRIDKKKLSVEPASQAQSPAETE